MGDLYYYNKRIGGEFMKKMLIVGLVMIVCVGVVYV